MNNYRQHVVLFLKRLLFLIILYTISRAFFYLLNTSYFSELTAWQLARFFAAGIRFDIAAILFTNIIFVFVLIPGSDKDSSRLQKIAAIAFFTINALAILTNFVDARFFDFSNKRSTSSIFIMMVANRDVWLLIPRFLLDYWYVAVAWIILMVLAWRWMPRLSVGKLRNEMLTVKTFTYQAIVLSLILSLMLLGARGTALKPISINTAVRYADMKYVPLVLNTPFTILKTLAHQSLRQVRYMNDSTLRAVYHPIHQAAAGEFRRRNVVVIILESFSREYVGFFNNGKGFTPCLDSILRKSLVCTNAYANGTQSYEAMPAIMAGIPSLMDKPYGGSNYSSNLIESLPSTLRKKGYRTSFFHGGNNGTMGFDNFALVAGVEEYLGRNEYNNDAEYDGKWGIWDEPFLYFFAEQLNTMKQPFFSSVFTLSSHHPYNIPDKYANEFSGGDLPIMRSIQYADMALGVFFRQAVSMPWFDSTLFVITADHAAQAIDQSYNSTTGMYAIPIAYFCPSDTALRGTTDHITQQIDIMPTLLGYLKYDNPFFAFGNDVMRKNAKHHAVSFMNGTYQLIEGDYVIQFDGQKVVSFYNYNNERPLNPVNSARHLTADLEKQIFNTMETEIKAIVQTYNSCLVNNTMTVR
jgi:phosphoglycerol transferase MdoB-like AlkP superfamily enzyme